MKRQADGLQRVVTTSVTLASALMLGMYGLTKYNQRKQRKIDEDEDLKDTSRPQNPNFGLSWGAQADALLMEEFDTGDLVLVNYECKNMLSLRDMARCYNDKFKYIRKYDSFGVIIRTKKDLKILLNHFEEPKLVEYDELLSRIYNNLIVAQKLEITPDLRFTKEEIEARLYHTGVDILFNFENFEDGFQKSGMNLTSYIMDTLGLVDKAVYQPVDISTLLTNKRFNPQFNYHTPFVIRQTKTD